MFKFSSVISSKSMVVRPQSHSQRRHNDDQAKARARGWVLLKGEKKGDLNKSFQSRNTMGTGKPDKLECFVICTSIHTTTISPDHMVRSGDNGAIMVLAVLIMGSLMVSLFLPKCRNAFFLVECARTNFMTCCPGSFSCCWSLPPLISFPHLLHTTERWVGHCGTQLLLVYSCHCKATTTCVHAQWAGGNYERLVRKNASQ